jgi:hypothetical protein
MGGMANSPPTKWRPLTIGDAAFLLSTRPDYLKKKLKVGTFCLPRWVSTSDQRLWALGDLQQWADEHGKELRPIEQLESAAEFVRRALQWEVAR